MMKKGNRKRILILGGAFAGLQVAKNLSSRDFAVSVVDRNPYFEFLPNIHELVSGVKSPETLRLPIFKIAKKLGHVFIQDEVVRIVPVLDEVQTRAGRRLYYDALVVATGGVDATFGVKGVKENAIGFKSVNECHQIGVQLQILAESGRPASVVIVGGGIEGVESLGEILRRYRNASHVQTTLVDAGQRLMLGTPKAVDQWIRKACEPYSVNFRMGKRVRKIDPNSVSLDNGEILSSDLTIWTGGIAPPSLLLHSGLTENMDQWLDCNKMLQSTRHSNIFVAGDIIGLNPEVSKQAYNAMDQGALVAKNLKRYFSGKSMEPFNAKNKPMLVSFGDLGGFMVFGDLVVEGGAMSLAKEAVFQSVVLGYDTPTRPDSAFRLSKKLSRGVKEILLPAMSSISGVATNARVRLLSM